MNDGKDELGEIVKMDEKEGRIGQWDVSEFALVFEGYP